MYHIKSTLPEMNIQGKRVFLRADLNVPLLQRSIISDLKLEVMRPTIDLIFSKGGKIILATHLGRPDGYQEDLSTTVLIPWFQKHNYSIIFESDLTQAYEKSFQEPHSILLLDNLRFYNGEKNNDPTFAQQLAQLADFYVNDAFGMIHRTDCSVWQVPQLFTPATRTIGLLLEKELKQANKLYHAKHPFTVIIGGKKVCDKLKLLQSLLAKIDTILLCPAFVFTFLHAQNKGVGSSYVESDCLDNFKNFFQETKKHNVKVVIPLDYVVSSGDLSGPYAIKSENHFGENKNDYGISIGPQTQMLYSSIISQAKTIFYNGLMGDLRYSQTMNGFKSILSAMSSAQGFSVVAGGDSSAATQLLGFAQQIDYISTGGGALIAYLANKNLPALDVLINWTKPEQTNTI